jgi:hypothetical protein
VSEARKTYLRAAGLIALNKREARKAALDRAHDIRKFEIELYWKRATYFWVLQAAVFTAFGLIWKDIETTKWGLIPVALSCLGVLTALSGWLSSLGSKFWQANWEHHIDMLEDEFEGRLHKTAWVGPIGVRWSVSGVNERLGSFFVMFWVIVTFIAVRRALDGEFVWGLACFNIDSERTSLFFLICAALVGAAWLLLRISELPGKWETLPSEPIADRELKPESRNTQVFPKFWKGQSKLRLLKRDDIK